MSSHRRRRSHRRSLAPLVALALLLTAFSGGATATAASSDDEALTPVTLIMANGFAGTEAGWLVAESNGFFEAEGLDVSIIEGSGTSTTVELLANGKTDFASFSFGAASIGRSNGRPIVTVAAVTQKNPSCLAVRQDSGITTLKDIEGRTVVGVPGSLDTQLLETLFTRNGVDLEKINRIDANFGTRNAIFTSGQADVMSTYIDDTFIELQQEFGDDVYTCLLWSDFGISLIGNGVVVNESLIAEDPELIRALLRGLKNGMEYSVDHPEEAMDALIAVAPQFDRDVELVKFIAHIPADQPDPGNPWGFIDSDRAVEQLQLVFESNMIDQIPDDLETYYTNDFLP